MPPDINAFRDFVTASYQQGGLGEHAVAQLEVAQLEVPAREPQRVVGQQWQTMGWRQDDYKTANRRAREAFLNAIKTTYGVRRVQDIPKAVREVMNLEDFGLGENDEVTSQRPLTAYRVRTVTEMMARLGDLPQRVRRFGAIADRAMTDTAKKELVALVKSGGIADGKKLLNFFKDYFGGEVWDDLNFVMAHSENEELSLAREVADKVLSKVTEGLVAAGVTHKQLAAVATALRQIEATQVPADEKGWKAMAISFANYLELGAQKIAADSFEARTSMRFNAAERYLLHNFRSRFDKLIKSSTGCDKLLGFALHGLWSLDDLDEATRTKLDQELEFLASNVKKFGRERTYLLAQRIGHLAEQSGTERMQARKLLGTMLKAYINISDSDLKQFTTTRLIDLVKTAADDSLTDDPAVLLREVQAQAEEAARQNYTDAETAELMSFAEAVNLAEPVRASDPEPPRPARSPEQQKFHEAAVQTNKPVIDDLQLLSKLFHNEAGWQVDGKEATANVRQILEANTALVTSIKDNWDKSGIGALNKCARIALNVLLGKSGIDLIKDTFPYVGALERINTAIWNFAVATTEQAKNEAAAAIAQDIDVLTGSLLEVAQKKFNGYIDLMLGEKGLGSNFKDLPPEQRPETADLLELAKSRHPVPKNETTAQRKEREAKIMAEYAKLSIDPQAGGLGTMLRSLATNYFSTLNLKEQRAMLAGVLGSVDAETLTDAMKDNTVVSLASKAVLDVGAAFFKQSDFSDLTDLIKLGENGKPTPAQQKLIGAVLGGLLKGCGPVLQKMVQMIGVNKLDPYLQKPIRDCKSNLKPIPRDYMMAKFKEIVRQSKGELTDIRFVESKGAASIAEAFECKLVHQDGREETAIIKMLRPDVRGRMEREIDVIKASVQGNGNDGGALRTLNARITSLLKELDFSEERENIGACYKIYGNTSCTAIKSVRLIQGCPQLPDAIVMEKAEGDTVEKYMGGVKKQLDELLEGKVKLDEDGHFKFTPMQPEEHARLTTALQNLYRDVAIRQANLQRVVQEWMGNAIFGDGRFHGDLHGGNLMVDAQGNMTLIDFGNAPVFSDKDRKNVVKLVVSTLRGQTGNILDAMRALVSEGSQRALDAHRADLEQKFTLLLGGGGLKNVPEKLTAVFGELNRVGVEIPESLYNFAEAFGRIQQLSSSMETTLTRISGALPYLREHEVLERPLTRKEFQINVPGEEKRVFMPFDEQIDYFLSREIEELREDSPNMSEQEIFTKLKERQTDGTLKEHLNAYDMLNPVMFTMLRLLSKVNSPTALLQKARNYLEAHGQKDFDPVRDAATLRQMVHENLDRIFAAVLPHNPGLQTAIDHLRAIYDTAYSDENMQLCVFPGYRFEFSLSTFSGAMPDNLFDHDAIMEDNFRALTHGGTPEALAKRKAKAIADATACQALVLRDEILPALTKAYEHRIGQVFAAYDAIQMAKPVTMQDSLMATVFAHAFSAIWDVGLCNAGAIYFGAKREANLEKAIPQIRANFNTRLQDFRTFASGNGGMLVINKEKSSEIQAQLKAERTVANAEARRALVELLINDRHVRAKDFYDSPEGRRIKALLGLDAKETMNNVETAEPLTVELTRQILAVHDIAEVPHRTEAMTAVHDFFGMSVNAVTYPTLSEKLAGLEASFGMETADFTNFLKANYGKVLAQLLELVSADPSYARTGVHPDAAKMQKLLVAALATVLQKGRYGNRQTPAALFGPNATALDNELNDLGLKADSPILTALRVTASLDLEAARADLAFLRTQINFKVDEFRDRTKDNPATMRNVSLRSRLLPDKYLKDFSPVEKKLYDAVIKLHVSLMNIASDTALAERIAKDDLAAFEEAKARIRAEIYRLDLEDIPDEDTAAIQLLNYWAARADVEAAKLQNPPQEKPAEGGGFFSDLADFLGLGDD